MQNVELLYNVSQWWIMAILLLAQMGVSVLGYWLGQKQSSTLPEEAKAHISMLQNVVFSLLTLTVSFTLSFALNRYESRRQAVLQEANAIGTTFLRSLTLPEPYRQTTKAKLQNYLTIRDKLYTAGSDEAKFNAALDETDKAHVLLWRDVEKLNIQYPDARFTQLYEIALNDLIDAHGVRVAALSFHIPEVILWLMIFLLLATNFGMGYSRGLAGSKQAGALLIISFIMLTMIIVIIDADRPRRGLIQVPNTPIQSLEHFIGTFYQK